MYCGALGMLIPGAIGVLPGPICGVGAGVRLGGTYCGGAYEPYGVIGKRRVVIPTLGGRLGIPRAGVSVHYPRARCLNFVVTA